MNAILLLSTAWMAGADPVPAAAPAPAVVATAGSGCGGCTSSCGNSCNKASILDRLRAKFAKSNCGCSAPAPKCHCERAPRCKPACGTPLFQGRSKSCNSCNTCAKSSCDSCKKPSILDRLKAKLGSWRHRDNCCNSAPTCCNSAPAGCAPAAPATPAPGGEAPKTMPKKNTGLVVPPTLTPVSNEAAPSLVVPALGGSKSPF